MERADPKWQERLFFHVRKHEISFAVGLNVYDWDRLTGK
jgi:hypothetical protein